MKGEGTLVMRVLQYKIFVINFYHKVPTYGGEVVGNGGIYIIYETLKYKALTSMEGKWLTYQSHLC